MTPTQAAELAHEDAQGGISTLHALVREAMAQVAAARVAELNARHRADRLAQIVQGANGLAECVLRGDHDSARSLATMVAIAIGGLQP